MPAALYLVGGRGAVEREPSAEAFVAALLTSIRAFLAGYDEIDLLSLIGIAILGAGLALVSIPLSLIVVGALFVSVNLTRLWLAAWRREKG